jgi:hypothetical protein
MAQENVISILRGLEVTSKPPRWAEAGFIFAPPFVQKRVNLQQSQKRPVK